MRQEYCQSVVLLLIQIKCLDLSPNLCPAGSVKSGSELVAIGVVTRNHSICVRWINILFYTLFSSHTVTFINSWFRNIKKTAVWAHLLRKTSGAQVQECLGWDWTLERAWNQRLVAHGIFWLGHSVPPPSFLSPPSFPYSSLSVLYTSSGVMPPLPRSFSELELHPCLNSMLAQYNSTIGSPQTWDSWWGLPSTIHCRVRAEHGFLHICPQNHACCPTPSRPWSYKSMLLLFLIIKFPHQQGLENVEIINWYISINLYLLWPLWSFGI